MRNVDDTYGVELGSCQKESYKYILMVMDIISKYDWTVPVKFKTGETIKKHIRKNYSRKKQAKFVLISGPNSVIKK